MKVSKFYFLAVLFFNLYAFAQRNSYVSGKDVFGTRVFIENKGQFNSTVNSAEPIRFGYETSGEHIYFTQKGLVYKLIKRFPLSEEQIEKLEKGQKVNVKPDEVHYVNMNWVNANENIQVIESNKQNHYFTYGTAELNSFTYKKLTFKNVYDNIDIEYTIPENENYGIKYNVILHPGANPNSIKIAYSGDVEKIIAKGENIIIKTSLEDITEHAPESYYDNNEKVLSNFELQKNVISFSFPNGLQKGKTLIIDPWVTTLTTVLSNNFGYDVDYDGSGNLLVYGGLNQIKVAKYNPAGGLIWTFAGVVGAITWSTQGAGNQYLGNFIVNKINGKIYIGQGFEPSQGSRVIRLDAAGNYDNFVTTPIITFREIWDMGFHCASGNVYGLGGTTANNTSAALIDQITGTMTTANFTGLNTWGQDVVSNAIDDFGNVFVCFASNGTPQANNALLRINPAFNGNIWFQPSTYSTFTEANNKSGYGGALNSNGFNCLAVNNNYLFYYDGFNLAAYNKATGVKLGFTTIAGLTAKQQGGIDVDDCNNVYVGGNGNILCYYYNGTSFIALPSIALNAGTPAQKVFDLRLSRQDKLLYVTGSGFAGTYSAIASSTCGVANAFSVSTSCAGINNSSGVASVTTSILSPTINYIWISGGNTISAVSTTATSNTAPSLPNGTYTVLIQVNAPCGPSYSSTLNLLCCPSIAITQSITQASCSNTVNSVSLNIAGGGTVNPIIIWSPAPAALGVGSLSATGLVPGTNTVTLNYGGGCLTTLTMNILPTPPAVTFTINNLTGSYSITCTNPTINLSAVTNYTYGALTYSWTSPSFTSGATTVAISQPNSLTLTVTDPLTGCIMQQTVAIGGNTIAPTNSVNPTTQAITCNSTSPVTFSATVLSPSVNIQSNWYSPLNPLPNGVPIASAGGTISILTGSIAPGVYTVCTTNLVNGCSTCKNVTITSLDAWPTFGVNSTTNYSLGCIPLNQTTLCITNPVSTQTPAATCSYTFLPPSFAGTLAPGPYSGNACTITTMPGTWTLIVNDNSNSCKTILSVPIVQNTVAPNVSASMFTQTLTCRNPTVLATGTSSTPNTLVTWNQPTAPQLVPVSTIIVGPGSGPNTSTTSLTYASYTVIATNTLNACVSPSVFVFNQNFKPPISSPIISIGTPTAIYCTAESNPVVLTTGNSTTTSGGGPTAFVANPCWQGPSPQTPTCGPSSYNCFVPGVYTLTVMDNYNGCTKAGTVNVIDRTQPPVLTNALDTAILDCGTNSANLAVLLTGTTTGGVRYLILDYPLGASFSPASAISYNINPNLSGTTSSIVSVSQSGLYKYIVTNTLTGCQAYGDFEVVNGKITANLTPDPAAGYAPLTVNFTNNSSSSIGSSSISTVWSFGNGATQNTSTNINTTATYTAPGTYTVMIFTSKGSCLDTAYKIIRVDIPSKLEVPNVFTPNGDGSNDVFFLKTTNLGEITAIIFDRWGNKVYETISSTGNIAWDGKNFQGKDCSAGVYFYIITASGKDAKEYKAKGNVSLFR